MTTERMTDALDKIRNECGSLKCRLCGNTNSVVVENDVGRRETVECPECTARKLADGYKEVIEKLTQSLIDTEAQRDAANERAEKAETAIPKIVTGYESTLRFNRIKNDTLAAQVEVLREGLEKIIRGGCLVKRTVRDTLAKADAMKGGE